MAAESGPRATSNSPAVLHLRRGDPLPPLPTAGATSATTHGGATLALVPGAWTLLVSVDADDRAVALAAAEAALAGRHGVELVVLLRGAVAPIEPPCQSDPTGAAADRLGALADAAGARAALLVLVEPRQTVQASVVGCDAAAFSAVLAPLVG